MIISDKRKATMVQFKEVECGQCFVYPEDNSVCLKIEEIDGYNCVDLNDGQLSYIANYTEVIIVNSRLEIW